MSYNYKLKQRLGRQSQVAQGRAISAQGNENDA